MGRPGKKTRNSMPTYHIPFPRSKNLWKSVEQNTLLSLLALEGFLCCSDEIWLESKDGKQPVLFPFILSSPSDPLCANKILSFEKERIVYEIKYFNLGMSTLGDSERSDTQEDEQSSP